MIVKLMDKPSPDINPKVQACINRKIPINNIKRYLTNTFEDINAPETFGEELLKSGVKRLMDAINAGDDMFFVVDSDVDGLTSSAILINYLYELFPAYVTSHVHWGLHEGKGHGLADFISALLDCNYSLVVCPDSATNDIEYIKQLHEDCTEVLILDHHLSEVPFSEYAITINSQYHGNNKELSGAGVVLKFCQYMDKLLNTNIANKFKDLAAVGLQSDMMDIRELESKEMIFEGFQEGSLHNPLIYNLYQKSEFACSKADYIPSDKNGLLLTPIACSFFITPLLNAVCRSGTKEEKELTFKAMLTHMAFKEIPSTKRGHKPGEMETIVTQMTRQITNIKNRQERAVTAGMEMLEAAAADMMDRKVFVFTLEPSDMEPNIRGLCANKLMAKYQRPVAVTTRLEDGTYAGSMRGYTATGIESFKDIAEKSQYCTQVIGHHNAAGIFLSDPAAFVDDMDKELANVSTDIVHYVDYMWDADNVNNEAIIDLAEMNDYIGTGFPRPLVYVHDVLIDNFMFMKEKHLKINLPGGCSAIMWDAPEELRERLLDGEVIKINFVAVCNINEWNWQKNPQLIINDWEEVSLTTTEAWGF